MSVPWIYMDYNATTPVDERVVETMLPYFTEQFGNASSIQHPFGWEAEEAVDQARESVAQLIGARSQEITFTSGATEAINLALLGLFESQPRQNSHVITCVTEHKAVLDTCKELERQGVDVTYLEVNDSGLIDLQVLESKITDRTMLIAIMHSNNEIGVIQPIKAICELAHQHHIPVMTDATQSVGKIPFDVQELGVDMVVCSAHKLYGPKGVGALYKRLDLKLHPRTFGGGHEKGIRSGTLNVPGIVGFGKACELCMLEDEQGQLGAWRDQMELELKDLPGVQINGAGVPRLPHMLNCSIAKIDGHKLMRSLKGLAVSQGSACNSSVVSPSHVLKAIGLSDELALASLRISLGRMTTEKEVLSATQILKSAILQLKQNVA